MNQSCSATNSGVGLPSGGVHEGLMDYGAFSFAYDRAFRRKWAGTGKNGTEALGTQDIQALADLGASFARVSSMRMYLWDSTVVAPFMVTALHPMVPLLLIQFPVTHLIRALLKAMG